MVSTHHLKSGWKNGKQEILCAPQPLKDPKTAHRQNHDRSCLNGHLAGKLVAMKLPNHERSGGILNHPSPSGVHNKPEIADGWFIFGLTSITSEEGAKEQSAKEETSGYAMCGHRHAKFSAAGCCPIKFEHVLEATNPSQIHEPHEVIFQKLKHLKKDGSNRVWFSL